MTTSAMAQDNLGTAECLQNAERAYKEQWARECAARSLGSNQCALPRLAASELRLDRSTDRSYCFSLGDRGMLKEPPAIVMPGAGGTVGSAKDDPPPAEQPPRKFWISPQ